MENHYPQIEGKILKTVVVDRGSEEDSISFIVQGGEFFKMYHEQDCCESVSIEDIVGDLSDLIGNPILKFRKSSNMKDTKDGSETWTFYNISTIKGTVTIRWYGESNGYYSESVGIDQYSAIGERTEWRLDGVEIKA